MDLSCEHDRCQLNGDYPSSNKQALIASHQRRTCQGDPGERLTRLCHRSGRLSMGRVPYLRVRRCEVLGG